MRTALALILLASTAFAQDPAAVSAAQAACGPKGVNFDVKDDNSQHAVGQPEASKALVYVIQDLGLISCLGSCGITKVGVDGAWVGANHHNSYVAFAVDPGEHHICVNSQSHIARISQVVGLAHFTAEAGKIYYFRTRWFGDSTQSLLDLDTMDSDQGRFFVADYPLSVSHPKK
jgi:hypothetical protein